MFEEETQPKRKAAHEIGQPLDALSIEDIDNIVTLLQDEITRLEDAKRQKNAVRQAAAGFFKN